ncbi:hypothetical protein AJ80_10072 [Polytolypa hystricis UAMH7299]|uniref:Uncharacterized protein n=1 Tax=Polytolypa hystricis (strain UAMH7299) TaxID=1447883 RepID=A0A2B7W631_POLH7|nr:hypothetical protein AJ80_10072 [Polytolypa hystricis UAMH7299]
MLYGLLTLFSGRFMLAPEFTYLYNQFGATTLRAVHQSLNIEDRVAALIRKERLLNYPEGSSLAEYAFDQHRPIDEQWIREVYHYDNNHYLIICFSYDQAKAFQNVQCFEMDMSFKMVKGKTNTFTISSWDDTKNRIQTYAYVFTNLKTQQGYKILFIKLFEHLGNAVQQPV